MRSALTRALLIGLSLAAVAWFVLLAVQSHDTTRATQIARSAALTPAQASRARSLISTASFLNPDQTPGLLRARVAEDLHQTRRAERILLTLTRAQPQNVDAWFALASIAGSDKPLERRALDQIARLAPPLRRS